MENARLIRKNAMGIGRKHKLLFVRLQSLLFSVFSVSNAEAAVAPRPGCMPD
jgi:hypothetical protein